MSDDRLRTALRELADVPPTPDLASAALRRMERDLRRARIALIVGVVLAVTAVLVVPATLLGRNQAAPPATPPASITGPGWVSAYYGEDNQVPAMVWRAYDPAAKGYRDVPGPGLESVNPSPDGKQAIIESGDQFAVVPIARILRPRIPSDIVPELTGNVWSWSPDSTKLLGSLHRGRLTEATVFDVRTRTLTRIPLHLDPTVRLQQLGWAPDGGFVVTTPPQFSIKMQPQQRTEVDFLDPDGRITRRLFLAKVDEIAPSPDGTMALLAFLPTINNVFQRPQVELLDLRTNERTPSPLEWAGWAYGHRLYRLDEHFNPKIGRPTAPTSITVVDAATGTLLRKAPLPVPKGVWVQKIDIAVGPVPPGAIGL
jgi:hypothetical protein